jgi:3-dehydroquinate dehydratase type I
VVTDDPAALQAVEPDVDLFELRIDLIGSGWRELAAHLGKRWIACNRRAEEGGGWQGSEADRTAELLSAVAAGASIVDIELATPEVAEVVRRVKGRADCLLSYHNLKETPAPEMMKDIVRRQLDAGADICKLVTTARNVADNMAVLRLPADFPGKRVVSFAMGDLGNISRVLGPLAGGDFTYASLKEGRESAPGQLTVQQLRSIYGMLKIGN